MKKIYLLIAALAVLQTATAQITLIKSGLSDPQGAGIGNRVVYVDFATGQIGGTDGTEAGTADIPASTVVLTSNNAALVNGKIVFTGQNTANGSEIWASDGSIAGTVLLKDINAGVGNSDPQGGTDYYVVVNNVMYFTAHDGTSRKLWKTDGTAVGTAMVKDISGTITFPQQLTPVGADAYFIVNGRQLWKTNGTSAGTVMVKDLGVGAAFSNTFLGNGTYTMFVGNNGVNGYEVWRTDGTDAGTIMLVDLNPGLGNGITLFTGGAPDWNCFMFNNTLYFQPSLSGVKLYRTNGTVAGTSMVIDVAPLGGTFLDLQHAVPLGSQFFFAAQGELFRSDGTAAGTSMVKDINPGSGTSNPMLLKAEENLNYGYSEGVFAGGRFFFIADDGTTGRELWASDGTSAGTVQLGNINPGSAHAFTTDDNEMFFTKYKLLFVADNGTNGKELWQSDGTPAGTSMVQDITAGAGSSNPMFFGIATASNKLIFRASVGTAHNIYALNSTVVPFPVTLTAFTANYINDAVMINWTTQQENGLSHFNLQRSVTGIDFTTIVKFAATNTNKPQDYQYEDKYRLRAGKYYYRLEMKENDGKATYSKVVPVTVRTAPSFQITTTSTEAVISINDKTGMVNIRLMDVNGRIFNTIQQTAAEGQVIRMPISYLSAGIYFITVETESGVQTQSFMR